MRASWSFIGTAVIIAASSSAAWAGVTAPATPGPLIGAGIPALAGFAWVYRRVRGKRQD